jgi:hypothetical protein
MKKQIAISALVLTVAGSGLFTAQAFAQEGKIESDTLIQKISDTFTLNKADVEKVFVTHRSEHKAEMVKKFEERLDQAVKDGKLTEAQKTLILNKRKELSNEMKGKLESFKSMAPEERKAAMQKQHQELEEWAKQNSIDLTWLMHGFKVKMHFGPKR